MKIDTTKISKSAKGNYLYDDKVICMVTHPNIPNHSGKSRGRSIHLSVDGKKSICNMLVVEFFQTDIFSRNKLCKICFKP